MTPIRIVHTCIYAQGNDGKDAYICEKTGCNCTAQFFCHNENYWKPTFQIKCSMYSDKVTRDESQDTKQTNNK